MRDMKATEGADTAYDPAMLEMLFEHLPVAVNLLDLRSGRYIYMNSRQVELTGFSMEELNALPTEEALARVHPDDRVVSAEQQRRIADGLQSELVVEYRWRVKSGQYRWFSDQRTLIRGDAGRPRYLLGVSRDITEERIRDDVDAQAQLAEAFALEAQVRRRTTELIVSERHYRLLAESTADLAFELAPDRRIRWASGGWVQRALARPLDDLIDTDLLLMIHPVDRDRVQRQFDQLCDGLPFEEGSERIEVRLNADDGSYRWMAQRLKAVRSSRGELLSILAGFTDIEDLVAERSRARAQAELLRAVTDAALEPQVLLQVVRGDHGAVKDFVYLDANSTACSYMQMSRHELVGRTLSSVMGVYVCNQDGFVVLLQRAIETGVPVTIDDFPLGDGRYGRDQYLDVRAQAISNDRLSVSWRNVTDRHRAALDLATSEAQLREAAMQKDRFINALSHELRNPLAALRLALWSLRRLESHEEDADRTLRIMERQLGQITRLVDDLLDVARLTSGRIAMRPEPLDLTELLATIVEDAQLSLRAKGLVLEAELPNTPALVHADHTRISQALTNLLQNAEKFTEPGGHIRVEAAVDSAQGVVFVTVEDTGAGMDGDTLSAIFNPFGMPRPAPTTDASGLGLGLPIALQIVERHGGQLRASSRGLGKGSTFEVRLPLSETSAMRSGAEPAPPMSGALRPLHVLLIEDDEALAAMTSQVLELLGHRPVVAHTGPQGLALAEAVRPEVVLCDIGLPGMDGLEVAKALREHRTLGAVPRVALSGFASAQDVEAAQAAGFHLHLAKPVTPEVLQQALQRCADGSL